MLNRISVENAQSLGIGVLEVVDEKASLNEQPEALFVPLKETFLSGSITGPVASLDLTQVYSFTKEQCSKVIESRYRFPVPGDAVVTGVRISFGDTVLKTELKERGEAKEDYKKAKQEGKKALLVTRESPDVFTICIAGIEPDQAIKVITSYVQLARLDGVSWSIRVPLTTAPRFTRKDEFSSRHAQGQPLAVLRDPGHRFSLDLSLHGVSSVESATHRINIGLNGDHVRIKLQQGFVVPDKDFVLSWKPSQETAKPSLHVIAEQDGADEYFVAAVMSPISGDMKKVPGEYVILVDHSGSMEGAKWQAADWAVEKLLRGLGKEDKFALCLFHSTTRWLSKAPMQATEANVTRVISDLKASKDSGGTELGVAMEQAVSLKKAEGVKTRNIVLITDAEVTDEGRIMRLVSEEAASSDRRRVNVLCIDAAPNSLFALEMAEMGGGIARFLTSDPEEGDIVTALDGIMESIGKPAAAGLRLFVNRDKVAAAGRQVTCIENGNSFIDMGDLPAGGMAWVAGKASLDGNTQLSFCLLNASEDKAEPVVPEAIVASPAHSLRGYFGARRVLGLEYLIHSRYAGTDLNVKLSSMGYDPAEVLYKNKKSSLYPENSQVNEKEALKDLIVSESLRYGIPSSETAFVAVYEVAGQKVEETVTVPNALPDGWSREFELKCCAPPASAPRIMASPGKKSFRQNAATGVIEELDESFDTLITPSSRARSRKHVSCIIDTVDGSPASASGYRVVFRGKPAFTCEDAVLFDTSKSSDRLWQSGGYTVDGLRVEFPGVFLRPQSVEDGAMLLIFVDDMLSPKASVKIEDVMNMRGTRPLNISVRPGALLKLVLRSPPGGDIDNIVVSLSIKP